MCTASRQGVESRSLREVRRSGSVLTRPVRARESRLEKRTIHVLRNRTVLFAPNSLVTGVAVVLSSKRCHRCPMHVESLPPSLGQTTSGPVKSVLKILTNLPAQAGAQIEDKTQGIMGKGLKPKGTGYLGTLTHPSISTLALRLMETFFTCHCPASCTASAPTLRVPEGWPNRTDARSPPPAA